MIMLDVNLLIYAYDKSSPFHLRTRNRLDQLFVQGAKIGMPWPTLLGFLRLLCNQHVVKNTVTTAQAWQTTESILAIPGIWIPLPGEQHARILGRLLTAGSGVSPRVIHDAHLAALAIEHGLILCSTDGDFARFEGLRWENPLARPGQVGERKVRYRTKPGTKRSASYAPHPARATAWWHT